MMNNVILQDGGRWLAFGEPVRVVTAVSPQEVYPALQAVDTAVSQGLYAAGFISYEAGAAFNLAVHPPQEGLPLLWFGLYELPIPNYQYPITNTQSPIPNYQLGQWQPSVSEAAYHDAISAIKKQIAAGYTYQVNYTYHLRTAFEGDPLALFADLTGAQQAEYTAFIDTGRFAICSASPELFFQLDGDLLLSKPMKGTAVRGRTLAEDRANMTWLYNSEKNRAENVMIVDMIRNDMGRVAEIGSVQVPRLFEVERYPTVLQMTSTVTAKTQASLSDIMAHMFPCASITGAPKVQTMQIINELEPEPRGVYTGAIGFISPEGRAQFNVAIRTVVIDKEQGTADYGVGSGIVWDSDATEEYEECRVKTQVLAQASLPSRRPSFSLLESLLWEPETGYFLLDRHIERLMESAEYFGIAVDETAVREILGAGGWGLGVGQPPLKVRLLVARNGNLTVQAVPLSQGARVEPIRVGLAAEPVDSDDIWLYHKTTRRDVYDQARADSPAFDEVILWNERGEITEATTANVVVELDGRLWTPPVESGLLAGTFRAELLAQDEIAERVIPVEELQRCSQIWLINSVRGWQTAELVPQTAANPILAIS